jgi:hypothetical protein
MSRTIAVSERRTERDEEQEEVLQHRRTRTIRENVDLCKYRMANHSFDVLSHARLI